MTQTLTSPVATPVAQPAQRVSPYGLVGTDVSALTDRSAILKASGADFMAYTAAGQVECLDGVTRDNGTLSVVRDDTHEILGTHKTSYHPIQYDTVLDIALEAVGLSNGSLDTVGVPRGGAQFYAVIDLGSLTLDPSGVADTIKRFLVLLASHNGTLPIMFVNRMHRMACQNELPSMRQDVKNGGGFATKHTKNVLDRLKFVKSALGISAAAEKAFVEQANRMLLQPATATTVERIATKVYGVAGTSEKAKTTFDNRMAALKGAFANSLNSQAVGDNVWAVYNAFTEYEDHLRGTTAEKRALASITPGGAVDKKKIHALNLCLAACN